MKKSVSKESIVFPEIFSGKHGEDVYKFKEKILQAVFDSQTREKDKVDVLRSYLSGDAKTLIGTHFTDINKALETLEEYFGHPDRIWENKLSIIKTTLGGDFKTCWGSDDSQRRVMAISQYVEFLKEAEKTAETYKELKGEIYGSSSYYLILNLLPRETRIRFNRLISGLNYNYEEKIAELATFMDTERGTAEENFRSSGSKDASKEKKSYGSQKRNDSKNVHFADGDDSDNDSGCKYCNGKSCKQEWDALGCLEIYKLQDANARIGFMKKKNICFMCGVKRNQDHKCGWKNKGKINTQCNTYGCRYGAAMCGRHKQNFSAEMKKWLKNVLTNTTHLGFHINGPTGGGLISTSGILTATTSFQCENVDSPISISKSK